MHHHHSETYNCKTSILTKLIIEKYVVTKCNPFISDLCEIAFSNPLSYSWCPGRNQSISFLDSSFLWMHDEQCVCRSSGRCYCASSSSYPKELQKIALGTQGSSRKRILAKSSPPSSFFSLSLGNQMIFSYSKGKMERNQFRSGGPAAACRFSAQTRYFANQREVRQSHDSQSKQKDLAENKKKNPKWKVKTR